MNTTIPSIGSGYHPASVGQADGLQAGNVPGKHPLDGLDFGKHSAEAVRYARQFEGLGRGEGELPAIKSFGAPRLDAPVQAFSADDMVDLLRSLRSKSQDEMLKTAKAGVESARVKAGKNTEKQLAALKEWIEKTKSAESKGKIAKIFSWVGRAVAFVASAVTLALAVAATVASVGGATPLLAVALVGFAGASISLASAVATELGGSKWELSFANMIKQSVGNFLTEVCGVESKLAQSICKVVGGGAALLCPVVLLLEPSLVGDVAQGIAELAGANEKTAGYIGLAFAITGAVVVSIGMIAFTAGTSLAASATQASTGILKASLKVVSSVITGTTAIASGSVQIASGGITISKAKTVEQADRAIATKKELSAMMLKLKQQMDEGVDEMRKITQDMEEACRAVNAMMAGATQSMTQVAKNMSSSPKV